MDPDVIIARQLVYAYCDALDLGDSEALDYAEEQLADFVDEADDATPDRVLVALLDLPLDAGTLALLNEVSAKLRRRGPGVVEALLEAALGEAPPELGLRDVVSVAGAFGALLEAATRDPNVSPSAGNAHSVLVAMPEGDLILGLIEVLEGSAAERVKKAASEMLVDIGDAAVGRLQMSSHDRDAEPWVTDTLVDIREGRDPAKSDGEALVAGAVEDDEPYDAGQVEDDEAAAQTGGEAYAVDQPAGDEADEPDGDGDGEDEAQDADPANAGEPQDADPADSEAPQGGDPADTDGPHGDDPADAPGHLPSADTIDRGYDAFLAKFRRETGQR